MQHTYRITVFTPTYNRAYLIHQLFESLLRQTFTNFEWLVIDDGSSDDTEELFTNWQKVKYPFPIRYVKQENGGKCRAINHALDLAQGELFFTVDSDDYLTNDALEKIDRWESQLPPNSGFCGIAGNLGKSERKTTNYLFDTGYYDGNLLDRYRFITGERAIVFYTKIHQQYRYPEFVGENFITEAVTWNRMAHDGYKMRFYNDIIWIYEYKEDGLTKAGSSVFINNPHGYGLFLKEKAIFMHDSFNNRQRMVYTFTCDLSSKYRLKQIAKFIDEPLIQVGMYYYLHKFFHLLKGASRSMLKRFADKDSSLGENEVIK